MGVNKYASTFLMASCNKKTCNVAIKKMKIHNFFCKYSIEDNQVA